MNIVNTVLKDISKDNIVDLLTQNPESVEILQEMCRKLGTNQVDLIKHAHPIIKQLSPSSFTKQAIWKWIDMRLNAFIKNNNILQNQSPEEIERWCTTESDTQEFKDNKALFESQYTIYSFWEPQKAPILKYLKAKPDQNNLDAVINYLAHVLENHKDAFLKDFKNWYCNMILGCLWEDLYASQNINAWGFRPSIKHNIQFV